MSTTTLFTPRTQGVAVAAPQCAARTSAGASIPAHLVVHLADATSAGPEKLESAKGALRALFESCAARRVELLTLALSQTNGAVQTLFERAFDAVDENEFGALHVHLLPQSDGKKELVDAARTLAEQAQSGALDANTISLQDVEQALHARALPPVDFMLSIGAGERLGGVLLWHCAYAEFLFQPQPWWLSSSATFEAAFADYALRCRKFGGLA